MRISEITTSKPLDPQQARLEQLKRQQEQARKAYTSEKDRQSVQQAQKTIHSVQQRRFVGAGA
jgi:hypothetical protein